VYDILTGTRLTRHSMVSRPFANTNY